MRDTYPDIMASACGSLARYEANEASDLDLALVYDDELMGPDAAHVATDEVIKRLEGDGFDVSRKAFGDPYARSTLLQNIGGRHESNLQMTHRVLLLTEQAWVLNAPMARSIRGAIFQKYTDGAVSRGRHLTSLANDLHRYYRTLCVDYRFKVEEEDKAWAIRVMKLRHSRKLWHLGNLAVQCAARRGPEAHFDAHVADMIGRPPLEKMLTSLEQLDALPFGAPACRHYDAFLGEFSDPETRRELEAILPTDKGTSPLYERLRENARGFQRACGAIVDLLYRTCPDYIQRYVIL